MPQRANLWGIFLFVGHTEIGKKIVNLQQQKTADNDKKKASQKA